MAIRSYSRAINLTEILQRLPAIMIALWLGVISISMIPQLQIIEGGILFILFLSSCLLIDSMLNPKKIRDIKTAQALRTIGVKNYTVLIIIHLCATVIVAVHLSYILMKWQILIIICVGLILNLITSRFLSQSKTTSQLPNVTTVVGGVFLPMVAAFYIVGDTFDVFSVTMISGITFVYAGLELFSATRADLELAPHDPKNSSIEWEAISVAGELKLPRSRIKEIIVELYNLRNEETFKKIPVDKCMLFLPHCLRIADRCKATYNEEGLQCKHCSKDCKINILTSTAQQLGYKTFVVPGGAMVFNIAKKYQPQGVVAVACYNELKEGTSRTEIDYQVPFQIIPLRKDGCVNTDVCIEEVVKVLSSKEIGVNENN